MWNKLARIWALPDLRKNILFVLAMLILFRLAAAIPLPGINVDNLKNFFEGNQVFGLLNIFSGGGLERFSIMAMGVGPYITASIIIQLLTMIVPRLEKLSKEGEYGTQKINRYTRYLTVPLAVLQGYSLIMLLRQSPQPIITDMSLGTIALMIGTMTAGTVFLMWMGELISERKIGNGISLLIFAGIIAGLPSMISTTQGVFDPSQTIDLVVFGILALITIVMVVVMTEAQRNINVTYARRMVGSGGVGGSVDTHLPLRVNQAGVIPIIFAISIILFPPTVAQFFIQVKTVWVSNAARGVIALFQDRAFYDILYFLLVIGFTYFYTAIVFKPEQIAENLQKQGGFIPGIRPGKPTEAYLQSVMNKIILPGALFLGIIAVLPLVVREFTTITTLTLGGTSLLIVVSVVIETIKQIDAQLTMRDYDKLV